MPWLPVIRFLGSTKLTVTLRLLLAAGGIAGSLLYPGNTAFGKISTFNVFRSLFFLLPAALLAINVCFCVVPRFRQMPAGKPRLKHVLAVSSETALVRHAARLDFPYTGFG